MFLNDYNIIIIIYIFNSIIILTIFKILTIFIKSKLNEIYSQENENYIENEKIKNNGNKNSKKIFDDIEIATENYNKSLGDSYISKKTLIQMDKKYIVVHFLDEKIKEEFQIYTFVSNNDTFNCLIDEFSAKNPEYKGKKNKKFLINGKSIEMTELIKNLNINDSTKIFIEY